MPPRLSSFAAAALALLLALAAACGAGDAATEDDRSPPVLEITSPERGATSASSSLEITGRVIDAESGVASVEVNGVAAAVDDSGNFAVTLNTAAGITLLETVAVDAAGNEARDARAVLSGQLVDLATPVSAGLVGHIDPPAMAALGNLIGGVANGIDWTALATGQNPVAGSGGSSCNSYRADIQSVEHGGFAVETGAVDGGIDATVRVTDLVVRGRISFRAVCIGGSTGFSVTADAFELGGLVAPRLDGAQIAVDLEQVTSGFANFGLDVGAIPGFVEDHFAPRVRDAVAGILRDQASELVPELATDFLADFLAKTHALDLLGHTVGLAVWPAAMSWTAAGGTITLDAASSAEGAEGAVYLSSPRQAPDAAALGDSGLAVGVADDMINQLLAALWASGAFTDTELALEADTIDAVFGAEGTAVEVALSLPPVASFDGDGPARLVIGDLFVEASDATGQLLARFVVSAEIELVARTGGMGVALSTEAPRILAQVLETSPALIAPIDEARVKAIAGIAIGQLAGEADALLAGVPVPGVSGASLDPKVLSSSGGYLVIGGELSF